MEGLIRQVKFLIYDSKRQFIAFWVVVILFNLLGYYVNYKYSGGFGLSEVTMYNGIVTSKRVNVAAANIMPVMIFLVIYNLIMYIETFSVSIGFSATRRNFYGGVVVHNAIICFVMAVVETILLKLDGVILKLLGIDQITKVSYFDLKADNIIFVFITVFLQAIIFCAFMNLIAILSYRFGFKFWIAVGIVVIGGLNINTGSFSLTRIFNAIFKYNSLILFTLKLLLISAFMYITGWIFVRRMSIKPGR